VVLPPFADLVVIITTPLAPLAPSMAAVAASFKISMEAMSVGAITISSGVVITVASGSRWVVL
jgi:hypothetical protein